MTGRAALKVRAALAVATALLLLALLLAAPARGDAPAATAHAENRAEVDLAEPDDAMGKLNEALQLGAQSFWDAQRALGKVAWDEELAPGVRGAALTELAMAAENAFPSLASRVPGEAVVNRTRAVELYRAAAELGNATAQFRMATLYASGALGVERDPVRAVLHYYFAALNGEVRASMALGFRHSIGLGVPKDCKAAVVYYELAANHAVDQIEAQGVAPMNERERLSLDRKSRGYTGRTSRGEDEEVVDYYKHAAEKGDVSALLALGQIYFYGLRGVERDHARAVEYFAAAAESGEPMAQANLGHMLVKGMGTKQDLRGALRNLTAAAEAGSSSGVNGLGYMHLYGLGVPRDSDKARKYFNEAAEAGNAEAYYNLGALYVSGVGVRRRNYPTAFNYFTMAAQKSHSLAMHKLAQMNLHGVGTLKNCNHALHLFKAVAERGEPVTMLSRGFNYWNGDDDMDSALQTYLVAAELGYEVAQSNAAWLLDQGADLRGGVPGPRTLPDSSREEPAAPRDGGQGAAAAEDLAEAPADALSAYANAVQELVDAAFPGVTGSPDSLRLYELAAEQENVDARLKIGDFFYYGLGGDEANFELAAHHYKLASDRHNAQAKFNLGFMHQHGIGLPRDFHLAKRFYDAAESTHPDAKVPVSLALSGLWLHRVYRAVLHNEQSADLPPFMSWIAAWVSGGSVPPPGGGGASGASSPGGPAKEDEWELLQLLSDLEDDTVVAACLFVMLVLVLLIRSRDQRRRFLQAQRADGAPRQDAHDHED